MSTNTRNLIATLQGGLDDRFSCIRVINRDRQTGERQEGHQGALSVVFHAYDKVTRRDVALKFFDPDFQGFGAMYRMDLFRREAELLGRFQGKLNFLQLVRPLSEIPLTASEHGKTVTVQCAFFVLEWLEGDITEYFLRQDEYDALIKIEVFRQILLGVFRLHGVGIAHRDVKYDNLRRVDRPHGTVVVPIDYGTAVDVLSLPLGVEGDYDAPVGAPAFSPLEAQMGLAGHRHVVKAADIYALGCLLHDLFNVDLFIVRLLRDAGFQSCSSRCKAHMLTVEGGETRRLTEYHRVLSLVKGQVTLPSIDSDDTTVPASGRDLLDRLLATLTRVDYRDRESELDRILRLLDAAAGNIRHVRMDQRRRTLRQVIRSRRADRQRRKEDRLEHALVRLTGAKEKSGGSTEH
ncbi:MAG: hypothetical protein OXI55_12760 [Gammaproteobacteria bacterium]|nr:hypothetical protein [Gammaproteobacteria bacterium]